MSDEWLKRRGNKVVFEKENWCIENKGTEPDRVGGPKQRCSQGKALELRMNQTERTDQAAGSSSVQQLNIQEYVIHAEAYTAQRSVLDYGRQSAAERDEHRATQLAGKMSGKLNRLQFRS